MSGVVTFDMFLAKLDVAPIEYHSYCSMMYDAKTSMLMKIVPALLILALLAWALVFLCSQIKLNNTLFIIAIVLTLINIPFDAKLFYLKDGGVGLVETNYYIMYLNQNGSKFPESAEEFVTRLSYKIKLYRDSRIFSREDFEI